MRFLVIPPRKFVYTFSQFNFIDEFINNYPIIRGSIASRKIDYTSPPIKNRNLAEMHIFSRIRALISRR